MEVLPNQKGFNYFSTLNIFQKHTNYWHGHHKQRAHCFTVYREALFFKLECVIGALLLMELVVEAQIFSLSKEIGQSSNSCFLGTLGGVGSHLLSKMGRYQKQQLQLFPMPITTGQIHFLVFLQKHCPTQTWISMGFLPFLLNV